MKRPQSQVDKTQPQKNELHKQYRAIGPAAIAAALVFSRKRKPVAATTPSLKSGKAA
ncbi:transcriptional regulator [Oryzicola mucosus]|uniref:Transcriptional regulator n=1 Tax=Oryzicola mucosus TaxID=2767425 RepID=A0A8J6PLL3_9HYPH|nr:transcriptional regulator [Oryzicola mucosus]MBD0415821.1 transcriptional regulator [Oryzicola mucosus]